MLLIFISKQYTRIYYNIILLTLPWFFEEKFRFIHTSY